MPLPNIQALTLKSAGGILRVLITDVRIHLPGIQDHCQVKAIWDTGATGTAITKKIATQLGLIPSGIAQVSTANGTVNQNTYTIDVGLPNSVLIQGIIATEVDALSSGCDALIGMDVITLGDFSITNHGGNTCMSFRLPSSHHIDYVVNSTYGVTPIRKAGSNFTQPKKKRR